MTEPDKPVALPTGLRDNKLPRISRSRSPDPPKNHLLRSFWDSLALWLLLQMLNLTQPVIQLTLLLTFIWSLSLLPSFY